MKILILLLMVVSISAFETKNAPTKGRMFLEPIPTDISIKKWNLIFNINLETYFTFADTLGKLLIEMDPYCEPYCMLTSNDFHTRIRFINQKNRPLKQQIIVRSKRDTLLNKFTYKNEIENTISVENYTTNVTSYDTNYNELMTQIENDLSKLEKQTVLIKLDTQTINFTVLIYGARRTLEKIEELQNLILRIHSQPEMVDIIDIITNDDLDKLVYTFQERKKHNEQLPFGFRKKNTKDYIDSNVVIEKNVLTLTLSIPVIQENSGRSYLYKIVPIPLKMGQTLYEVKISSEFGIFFSPGTGNNSKSFIPFSKHELQFCKDNIYPRICTPSHFPYSAKSCELSIFNNDSFEKITRNCVFRELEPRNYIIQLKPYELYVSVFSHLKIYEYCPSGVKSEMDILEDKVLFIDPKCDLISEDFNFQGYQWSMNFQKTNNSNTTLINRTFLPMLNIHKTTDEPLQTRQKVQIPSKLRNKNTPIIIDLAELLFLIVFIALAIFLKTNEHHLVIPYNKFRNIFRKRN